MSDKEESLVVLQRTMSIGAGVLGDGFSTWSDGAFHVEMRSIRLGPELYRLRDGGWVIDKRLLEPTSEIIRAVISGPSLDIKLGDYGERSVFGDQERQALALMMGPGGLQGDYRAVGATILADPNFDGKMLGPAAYAEYWSRRGARIGRREGDEIVWSDGEREPVESEDGKWACDKVLG